MLLPRQTIALVSHPDEACSYADENRSSGSVAESTFQYRPRYTERSAFYQLIETHLDSYIRAHEERCKSQDPFETKAPPDVASAMVQ